MCPSDPWILTTASGDSLSFVIFYTAVPSGSSRSPKHWWETETLFIQPWNRLDCTIGRKLQDECIALHCIAGRPFELQLCLTTEIQNLTSWVKQSESMANPRRRVSCAALFIPFHFYKVSLLQTKPWPRLSAMRHHVKLWPVDQLHA